MLPMRDLFQLSENRWLEIEAMEKDIPQKYEPNREVAIFTLNKIGLSQRM